MTDGDGDVCVRMVNGSFRRGVRALGDIEPFDAPMNGLWIRAL